MWIAIWVLIPVYFTVSLIFFILSAMELLETGKASVVTLCLATINSVFWPITLLVVSVLVALKKPFRIQAKKQTAKQQGSGHVAT
ncbi:MAG: hypothetical protein K5905_30785 [Roseibium sp.]|uniref:hypothetical protein n=1 Tax=Roseibium sp. TaxID=1936156 RepID=UPI0026330F39|nr:hypothetical protein [Roseibium sp.]MCV0429844.1 hypothetical protein [Roseibium sp.]